MPSLTSPSAGIRSPGRTSTVWPIPRLSAGTSRVLPSTSTNAVLGTRRANARIPSRALFAATPSSTSPTAKRKTTSAASSAAPMTSAPVAAMVISISIVKGIPARAALKARRATGATPISVARTKAQPATSLEAESFTAHAAASRSAVPITSRPLPGLHANSFSLVR